MLIKCDYCGKEFERPTNRVNEFIKNGWKQYCSDECRSLSKKIKCTCAHCGKELWKTPSEIKRSKTGNVFCNRSCAASFNNSKFRTGKNNPNYKEGEGTRYTTIAYRTYALICTICGCNDPQMLEVHHIDRDRTNNAPDNLIVLCANHHTKLHRGGLEITEEIKSNRQFK